MKLTKTPDEYYESQSNAFINFYDLRCYLLGQKEDDILNIDKKFLSYLPPINDYNLAIYYYGDYQEKGDEPDYKKIDLNIYFNDNGMFFDTSIIIDLENGEVIFWFSSTGVNKNVFVLPKDFTDKKTIKAIKDEKSSIFLFNPNSKNKYFEQYIENKYLKFFEDWLDILEALPKNTLCMHCIHLPKLRLRKTCKDELYMENKYSKRT